MYERSKTVRISITTIDIFYIYNVVEHKNQRAQRHIFEN